MKLKDTPTRRIRILVHETESNKMVPGSSRSMAVYETTSQEVFELIQAAILEHVAEKFDAVMGGNKDKWFVALRRAIRAYKSMEAK